MGNNKSNEMENVRKWLDGDKTATLPSGVILLRAETGQGLTDYALELLRRMQENQEKTVFLIDAEQSVNALQIEKLGFQMDRLTYAIVQENAKWRQLLENLPASGLIHSLKSLKLSRASDLIHALRAQGGTLLVTEYLKKVTFASYPIPLWADYVAKIENGRLAPGTLDF